MRNINKAIRDITIIILIGFIGVLLSIGIIRIKDYMFGKQGIYEYGRKLGFTKVQVDKLIEGTKRRANDPNWE